MADKKKKPTLALVISVGPKMKTKPTDASTPDMKKYGSMPMKKAWNVLKYEGNFFPASFGFQNARPSIPFHRTPQQFIDDGLHRKGAKNYTRELDNPEKSEDEIESDMEEERQMQERKRIHHSLQNEGNEIPQFGDEDARQAEMNEAERAAIMAEGMPEMRKPRGAPRPGDPRFADPNQPRPSMPRDVFGKAWDMLKGERGGLPRNFKRTRVPPKPMRQVAPEPEAEPETPTPQKVAAAKQQFDFINNIRRKRGEPPISIDEHLQQAGLTLEDYDREYHPEALE